MRGDVGVGRRRAESGRVWRKGIAKVRTASASVSPKESFQTEAENFGLRPSRFLMIVIGSRTKEGNIFLAEPFHN